MHVLNKNTYQALFASCIPEIIDLIGTRPKYGGAYKNERGRRLAADTVIMAPFVCDAHSSIFTFIVFNKTGMDDDNINDIFKYRA